MPLRQKNSEVFSPAEIKKVEAETKSFHDYILRTLKQDIQDNRKNSLRSGLRLELTSLKERRVEADYREANIFDERTVLKAISNAQTALGYPTSV